MSRCGAAARFGVSVSSAIRWHQLTRKHGRAVAGKPGGDQRSSKTDAYAELIMNMLEERGDITLAEIQSGLAARGIRVGIGSFWRFFDLRGITRKKERARDRAKPSRRLEAAAALVRRAA